MTYLLDIILSLKFLKVVRFHKLKHLHPLKKNNHIGEKKNKKVFLLHQMLFQMFSLKRNQFGQKKRKSLFLLKHLHPLRKNNHIGEKKKNTSLFHHLNNLLLFLMKFNQNHCLSLNLNQSPNQNLHLHLNQPQDLLLLLNHKFQQSKNVKQQLMSLKKMLQIFYALFQSIWLNQLLAMSQNQVSIHQEFVSVCNMMIASPMNLSCKSRPFLKKMMLLLLINQLPKEEFDLKQQNIMNLLIYVFLISLVNCFESTCKYLHVSTDIDKSRDDIIKAGVPAKQWVLEADTFQLVNNSVQMDYLYVSMDNKIQLTQDMVQLEFDDHYFANSTLKLEHHQSNVYSLKIDYRCKQYGGRLIQYEVVFNIPSCGSAKIYWQKLCGSPLIKRHGLNVDALIKSYNQTVVKDGELVNKAYWDKDFDNFVFTVPANLNYSIFYVYMNLTKSSEEEKILKKEETKDFFNAVDQSKSDTETTQEEFQVLEAILKLIPEVHISPPYVDADHTITKPIIRGDLFKGGIVTDEPSTLIVEYNCVENGNTTIELNIPLQYFQDTLVKYFDLNSQDLLSQLIRVSTCLFSLYYNGVLKAMCIVVIFFVNIVSPQSSFSILSVLFYLICFGVVGFMLYTFEVHTISLSDIRRIFTQRQKFNYKATEKDEDIESEFKIGRLVDNQESKYGSI